MSTYLESRRSRDQAQGRTHHIDDQVSRSLHLSELWKSSTNGKRSFNPLANAPGCPLTGFQASGKTGELRWPNYWPSRKTGERNQRCYSGPRSSRVLCWSKGQKGCTPQSSSSSSLSSFPTPMRLPSSATLISTFSPPDFCTSAS